MAHGRFHLLCPEDEKVFAYTREQDGRKWLVVCNFYGEPAGFAYAAKGKVILSNYKQEPVIQMEGMELRPYEAMICEVIEAKEEQKP